jgi:AAA ATPase domain
MTPRCPKCNEPLAAVGDFVVCATHGSFPRELISNLGIIQSLPFPLAITWADYLRETNPFLKLHRLTDAIEILTRASTIVLVSDILRQLGAFPPALKALLAQKLSRPTFGAWKELVTACLEALPHDGGAVRCFIPELPAYIHETLLPLLGSNDGAPEKTVIALRNLLAHGGRLSREMAERFLRAHAGAALSALERLSFLDAYELVASDAQGRLLRLRGLPAATGNFERFTDERVEAELQGERVAIIRGSEFLDLHPLHAFAGVGSLSGQESTVGSARVPQIYFRVSSKGFLEFTPFTDDAAVSQVSGPVLERFTELFGMTDRRPPAAGEYTARLIDELTQNFVGRAAERSRITSAIEDSGAALLWLYGPPGIGKSTLFADVIKHFQSERKGWRVAPYIFKLGHAGCTLDAFVRGCVWNLSANAAAALETALTETERRQLLMDLLGRLARNGRGRVLLAIDGVDEIFRTDPAVIGLLREAARPGVVVLCSGRPEPAELVQTMREAGAIDIFKEPGLPGLDEAATRELLVSHLERLRYGLFERDVVTSVDGVSTWANPFVEAVVRRSEGLPLYLVMLVEDLRAGRLRLTDDARLPMGLMAYYDNVLDRSNISDSRSLVPPLLCALAYAQEPMSEGTMASVLKSHSYATASTPDAWSGLVSRAFVDAQLLLRRAPDSDGVAGWTFYHESVREHILSSGKVERARAFAAQAWLTHLRTWQATGSRYALRYFAAHLAEAECHDELIELLLKTPFLARKTDVLGDSFFASSDVRLLTQIFLSRNADTQLASHATDYRQYWRDGIVWGIKEALAAQPELRPRIEQLARHCATTRGSGGHEPGRSSRHAGGAVGLLTARRIALELATALNMQEILVQAAREDSDIIRGLLPEYLYRFWKADRESGWRVLDGLGRRSFRLGLIPDPQVLTIAGGMTMAIVSRHAAESEVVDRLQRHWRATIAKIRSLRTLMKAATFIMLRGFRWILAQQADYQPINLREVIASYSGDGAEQREGLKILPEFAHVEHGYGGTRALLLRPDLPYNVYLMILCERMMILHGVRDPGGMMSTLAEIHGSGAPWFRHCAPYCAYHILKRVPEVRVEWVDLCLGMVKRSCESGHGATRMSCGEYSLAPQIAGAEILLDRHRPNNSMLALIPGFLNDAGRLGDVDYTCRMIDASALLALLHRRFDLALNGLTHVADSVEPRVVEKVATLLANMRAYNDTAVDQFLAARPSRDLGRRVTATAPIVPIGDIASNIDDFFIDSMLTKPEFHRQVLQTFEECGRAASPNAVLMAVLDNGMRMIEGRVDT